ncbi:hypothetical protein ACFV07_07795 [Streptomyces anulatus]|uniref:hypothetical protein n=1 Tax=Streptomyces anulatus TaxID=1892 RepID=UPI0036B80FD8
MNAKRINAAAGVIAAALVGRDSSGAGIAAALEAAGLLQSPESAAEQAQLQDDITGACLARHEEEQENDRLRARVAELEALTPAQFQDCQTCGAGYEYGQPCQRCEFRTQMAAELAKAPAEDPHPGGAS